MSKIDNLFEQVDQSLADMIKDLENVEKQFEKKQKLSIKALLAGMVIGFAAALLLLATDAGADEINIPVTSWHSQDRDYYNNKNLGLGYSLDHSSNFQSKLGFYKNSFYKYSVYFGGDYHQDNCNFCLGVFVGGVTGYDKVKTKNTPANTVNKKTVQLMILPELTIRANKVHSITIGYIPALNKDAISFATLTYNYSF